MSRTTTSYGDKVYRNTAFIIYLGPIITTVPLNIVVICRLRDNIIVLVSIRHCKSNDLNLMLLPTMSYIVKVGRHFLNIVSYWRSEDVRVECGPGDPNPENIITSYMVVCTEVFYVTLTNHHLN
jgi:hypothetical protein